VVASENVMATLASQASVAVGGLNAGVAGQLIGVVCATQVIVGGVLSCTTIDLLQVAVLLQSSVAVHVLVTVKVPGQEPGVVASEKVIATLASQASVAVGALNAGTAGQLIGEVCATHVIVGGVLSCTTIVRLQVAVLLQSSVAVHVRVTLNVPGHDPGVVESEKVTVTLASQASVTVGALNAGTAGQLSGVVCVVQVSVGGILSITTTEALHVPVFPQSSVAVQVRVVV